MPWLFYSSATIPTLARDDGGFARHSYRPPRRCPPAGQSAGPPVPAAGWARSRSWRASEVRKHLGVGAAFADSARPGAMVAPALKLRALPAFLPDGRDPRWPDPRLSSPFTSRRRRPGDGAQKRPTGDQPSPPTAHSGQQAHSPRALSGRATAGGAPPAG